MDSQISTTCGADGDGAVRCTDLFSRLGVTPYYKNQWCAVIKGDCRDILPSLPKQTFDLLLSDPPYGINFESNSRKDKWGKIAGDGGSLDVMECLRMSLKNCTRIAHIYIFGDYDIITLPVCEVAELIWDKCGMAGGNTDSVWGKSHERISFGVRDNNKAWLKSGKLSAKKRRGSVLRCQRPSGVMCKNHPTEKPVELLRQLIESSTVMGETVLDPFVGCGSTLVAAHMEGRYAVGIEYEERHCETAAKRLEQLGAW
jgi:site-specific DNA-methyltransferase (adenine-specific)